MTFSLLSSIHLDARPANAVKFCTGMCSLIPPEELCVGVGSRLRNTNVDMGGVGRLYIMYIKMVIRTIMENTLTTTARMIGLQELPAGVLLPVCISDPSSSEMGTL